MGCRGPEREAPGSAPTSSSFPGESPESRSPRNFPGAAGGGEAAAGRPRARSPEHPRGRRAADEPRGGIPEPGRGRGRGGGGRAASRLRGSQVRPAGREGRRDVCGVLAGAEQSAGSPTRARLAPAGGRAGARLGWARLPGLNEAQRGSAGRARCERRWGRGRGRRPGGARPAGRPVPLPAAQKTAGRPPTQRLPWPLSPTPARDSAELARSPAPEMPLLHRKPFERRAPPADLRPEEEVFYCRVTREIFRRYE